MSTSLPPKTHYLGILRNLDHTLYAMNELATQHPMLAPHEDIAALYRMKKNYELYVEQSTARENKDG